MNLRPAPRLVWLLAGWTVFGVLAAIWAALLMPWLAFGVLLVTLALMDRRAVQQLPPPQATRTVNAILPVGVKSRVRLRLENPGPQALALTVYDHHPQPAQVQDLPQTLRLPGRGGATLRYRLTPLERGEQVFGPVQVVLDSAYGLWKRSVLIEAAQTVKVYPDFAAIAQYAQLAADQRITALGIHKRRRRGEGQEFLQLREYRAGDALRQVDWNATARHRKLIAKEYQEERNQPLLFLLDCSRRMRAHDGALSHFDHALNAMILLAYVALRQGDAVGVQSFGGTTRWLAPRQGRPVLNRVIGSVFDLQPTLEPPDYAQAASFCLSRQRKRALIVILTNLRDEDSEELASAVHLLARRHRVLIANLRESVLDELLEAPEDFQSARRYAAACQYLNERERCQQALKHQGGLVLDATPGELPVAVVNRYFDLKRGGLM